MDSLTRTRERFKRQNRLKGRNLVYCGTPLGKRVLVEFIAPLADFLAGKLSEKPTKPPGDLGELLRPLDPQKLALIVLAPLLDSINRGWTGDDTDSAEMLLVKKIGEYLRHRLIVEKLLTSEDKADRIAAKVIKKRGKRAWRFLSADWDSPHYVRAGHWLLQQALALEYFTITEAGFPAIAPEWQAVIDGIADALLLAEPYILPHLKPPPDWTGWRTEYGDRLGADFVRDWRPETRAAITKAFEDPDFEHARGVNSLQRVAFKIDQRMLDLVESLADKVLDHKKHRNTEQAAADRRVIKTDIRDAKYIGERPFWLSYNCDKRGRVYAIPHLNYGREDHVRSLFRFAGGMPLAGSIDWLEIHCANCEGSTDKDPWHLRHKWVAENRPTIQKIADNPAEHIDLWKRADKPFCYVAACIELAGALADPSNFITHLPIAFDGSANGLQHLALIARDVDAGKLVNLIDSDSPQDVYAVIIARTRKLLSTDSDKWAKWWRDQFARLEPKQIRKLIKTSAMTYAYSVTKHGMADQITEVYRDLFFGLEPKETAARYLAKKITEACVEVLPVLARIMDYIRDLSEHCSDLDKAMELISPTGFPFANRYNKANVETVYLVESGCEVRYRVANGSLPEIRKGKSKNASAPNLVHSLDASHLIRTVNFAAAEGIISTVPVHDSFSCMAPQAQRYNQIIRRELAMMYRSYDALGRLRSANAGNNFKAPPDYGDLDPFDVQNAEYPWA
jgi:DNA-directed RNA polymerase